VGNEIVLKSQKEIDLQTSFAFTKREWEGGGRVGKVDGEAGTLR